jgi:hypothetical protein
MYNCMYLVYIAGPCLELEIVVQIISLLALSGMCYVLCQRKTDTQYPYQYDFLEVGLTPKS